MNIAEAIAESTRTGEFVRLEVPDLQLAIVEARGAAEDAGLEFYPIATETGFDLYGVPEDEPETWKLEISAAKS